MIGTRRKEDVNTQSKTRTDLIEKELPPQHRALIENVREDMKEVLTTRQWVVLENTLIKHLQTVTLKGDTIEVTTQADKLEYNSLLKLFLEGKKLEGCTQETLHHYDKEIHKVLVTIDKPIDEITTDTLRSYFNEYRHSHKVSMTTLDNTRRILNSFFTWLRDEHYILENPVKRIKKMKQPKKVKKAFSDEEITLLRDNCKSLRETAVVEFLLSTGVRIGELISLDINDINFEERSCIVFGKGMKEREVYFDAQTKLHLRNYLNDRIDDTDALFVTYKYPWTRLTAHGIDRFIRELGIRAGVSECHPHKFRRTFATRALRHGIPIEQVQRLLGHANIETTMIYALVDQNDVRNAHRKYMG